MKLFLFILLLEAASFPVTSNRPGHEFVLIEKEYVNWVRQMSSFKHSLFGRAKNKLKPCLSIRVNKKPRLGQFATVQKAISSLPVVNNCRVVIYIGAGTYR